MRHGLKQAVPGSVAMLMLLGIAGCRTPAHRETEPTRPGVITHPVFFTLTDPADAPELIRDCGQWIAPIPGILTFACGRPFESGRAGVDSDYDVGLVVGFASEAAYGAYLVHPNHVRMQEKWRPRMRRVDIRDIIDESP